LHQLQFKLLGIRTIPDDREGSVDSEVKTALVDVRQPKDPFLGMIQPADKDELHRSAELSPILPRD
jgi:hypothetical protein